MRIALVTYGLHVGGMESFMLLLAEALRNKGHGVSFVVTEEIGAWHERAIEMGFEAIDVCPSMWQSRRQQVARLLPALDRFDAVILNHSSAAQATLGELHSPCLVLSVLHNDQKSIYRVGMANLAYVDYVVCVGTKILSEARRLGAMAEHAVHVPHGVEVPPVWPQERKPPRDGRPLKTIFVGRIDHAQKGVFDLPPILAATRRLGAEATFEVVGDGGQDFALLRRKFEEECPELPVVYHGRKSNEETIRLMSQADILLMPSRFEGFPVTLLEALAQGVIPIASRLPGITDDAVTNGVNGVLPEVGDIRGFAEAIVRLQDDALRNRMSQAAWSVAWEKFRKEDMVEKYLELLQRPRRARPTNMVSPDVIGRELFGRSWSLPIGLAKFLDAARENRLLAAIRRRVGNTVAKLPFAGNSL